MPSIIRRIMERRVGLETAQVVRVLGNPLFVTGTAGPTDRSTSVTTEKQLMPANADRISGYIANDSAIDVWVRPGGTAAIGPGSGNLRIAANGGYFTDLGVDEWRIISSTGAAAAITAREW